MRRPRRAPLDPRTRELRDLGRRLRREGRMSAAVWLAEAAPLYRRWAGAARDSRR